MLTRAIESRTMILTALQRKLLLRYRGHRRKPFTVVELLVAILPQVALAVGLAALSYYVFPPQLALFIAGLLVGVIARNLALLLHGARVIPALLQVIDWEKLDRLHEQTSRGT
jgi:hypothetical protein